MKTKCGQGGRRRGPDENDMKQPKLDERAKAAGVTWELAAESENGEGRIFWNPKIFGKGIYVTVDESWIQGCVDYAEAVKAQSKERKHETTVTGGCCDQHNKG